MAEHERDWLVVADFDINFGVHSFEDGNRAVMVPVDIVHDATEQVEGVVHEQCFTFFNLYKILPSDLILFLS